MMRRDLSVELVLSCSCIFCLVSVASGFAPVDDYLIDCGSSKNTTVGSRTFSADYFTSNLLSTTQDVVADTSSSSLPASYDSALYATARILTESSRYTFPVKGKGRHLIRLYFFPFVYGEYNLSAARFSVSVQNFTLLKDYQLEKGLAMKEYSINVTSDQLVLTLTPNTASFAFINALEVISLPDELIPARASIGEMPGQYQILQDNALETIQRVNMGNETVHRENDTLWRLWVSDVTFLKHSMVSFVSNIDAVNYSNGGSPTKNIAPASVYGTATKLDSDRDPHINANLTWLFSINPGFDYLVRFHFCDIVNSSLGPFFFNVYINSWYAYENFDLGKLTSKVIGRPYFFDVIARSTSEGALNVSVGPSTESGYYPMAILNGLEIMKISNSRGGLDASDSEIGSSKTNSGGKIILAVGLSGGILTTLIFFSTLFLFCRRRRRKLGLVGHSKEEDHFGINQTRDKHCDGLALFSNSKFGYRYPFVAIEEATNNFSEDLVIGMGGFGKVYSGVLRDGTKVAIKRGQSKSQGLLEFRTEIEMLSQFRHRHLVSLIGYCDEQNEMIIVYEFMEKGTLKNHLYGSDLPVLSWKKRLEICIGSAKGLHYLHTGSSRAIIHRDVKSANILLDENFQAKVADFGISKAGPEIDKTHVSTAVKGSFGYLDPEYLTRQQLTEKSDVYSFGVVMLEILCGRAVIDPSLPREKVNLVEWAMKRLQSGHLQEITDPCFAGQASSDSLQKFTEVAVKCLAKQGADRPSMGDVLWNLESALQLQLKQERSCGQEGQPVQTDHIGHPVMSTSTTQFSMGSMGDLGTSMSKVFANMVKLERGNEIDC